MVPNNPIDQVILTLKHNLQGVKNARRYRYSNGPLEGVIRKIKVLKRSCYIFHRLDHLFIRIKLIQA
ncbi:transposase [Lactobacillus sp. DCY120]|uniref:Transposase n=1 Tax=Bombilactobacillus apium TaxID=2675299 RepID=A0A850R7E7_9LACO|nr:transposase [Bombilactobacillus apium]